MSISGKKMNKSLLVVLAAAFLVASAVPFPRKIDISELSPPKFCKTKCDRRVEYCDATCTIRFGEGRTGEDPFHYKRCLDECALEYLYTCLKEC